MWTGVGCVEELSCSSSSSVMLTSAVGGVRKPLTFSFTVSSHEVETYKGEGNSG